MDLAVIRMLECFGKIQDFVVAEDIKSEQAASGRMFKEWSFSKEWNVKVKKKEKQQSRKFMIKLNLRQKLELVSILVEGKWSIASVIPRNWNEAMRIYQYWSNSCH